MSNVVIGDVVIGDIVHWYVAGVGEVPWAALVLEVNPGNMLSLNATNAVGQTMFKRNVWQRGSRPLLDNPELATRNGAWDYQRPPAVTEVSVRGEASEKPRLQKKDASTTAALV